MLLISFVTRRSSISHVFGDARKDAWYPIITVVKAPPIPAKPGPTLKSTRMVWTALPFEDWLMLLLLLMLLPLLGSLVEPSESQPEQAPAPGSCMAVGALPAMLHDLAPRPPALRFATAFFVCCTPLA